MNRNAFLICCLIMMGFAVQPSMTSGQENQKDIRFSDSSVVEAASREQRIKTEIEELKGKSWAGEYYYGDGLGVNVFLIVAPSSGFSFVWSGCLGTYDRNYGNVEWSDNKVRLIFTFPNSRHGFKGIASELVPVLWNERHYLIAADGFVEFANAVNGGFEPGLWGRSSRFLLRRGDENKKTSGKPKVPAEFQNLLLTKPIRTTILSIGESRI